MGIRWMGAVEQEAIPYFTEDWGWEGLGWLLG